MIQLAVQKVTARKNSVGNRVGDPCAEQRRTPRRRERRCRAPAACATAPAAAAPTATTGAHGRVSRSPSRGDGISFTVRGGTVLSRRMASERLGSDLVASPEAGGPEPIASQPLAGRVAIVTGASRGIGRVLAAHLSYLDARASCLATRRAPTSPPRSARRCPEPWPVTVRVDVSGEAAAWSFFYAAGSAIRARYRRRAYILVANAAGVLDNEHPSLAATATATATEALAPRRRLERAATCSSTKDSVKILSPGIGVARHGCSCSVYTLNPYHHRQLRAWHRNCMQNSAGPRSLIPRTNGATCYFTYTD